MSDPVANTYVSKNDDNRLCQLSYDIDMLSCVKNYFTYLVSTLKRCDPSISEISSPKNLQVTERVTSSCIHVKALQGDFSEAIVRVNYHAIRLVMQLILEDFIKRYDENSN